MSLTTNQKQHIIEAHEALKNRGIVYLSGRNNGKTRVISRLSEHVPTPGGHGTKTLRPRHAEDHEITFVEGLFYCRSDRANPYTFMRVILQELGEKRPHTFFETLHTFQDVLWNEFYRQDRVLALSIDNGDLLCEKAFTVLKYLNEMRRERKEYGCAAVIAGEFGRMRMPLEFLKRSTEIQIGPINAASDIAMLIETHYPGQASSFTPDALRRIQSVSETTLELRHNISKVIRKRHRAEDAIDADLVTLALAA